LSASVDWGLLLFFPSQPLLTLLQLGFFVIVFLCTRLTVAFPNVGLRIRVECTFFLGGSFGLLWGFFDILLTLRPVATLLRSPLSRLRFRVYVRASPGRSVDVVNFTLLTEFDFAAFLGL
jgi:hypothetical protein